MQGHPGLSVRQAQASEFLDPAEPVVQGRPVDQQCFRGRVSRAGYVQVGAKGRGEGAVAIDVEQESKFCGDDVQPELARRNP